MASNNKENFENMVHVEENQVPLLLRSESSKYEIDEDDQNLRRRVFVESEKLWQIVGPAIFSRITSYSMNVITQAFAGHLGDTELAAISIINNVVVGRFRPLVGHGKCFGDTMWTSIWSQEIPHVRDIHATFVDCTICLL